MPTSGTKPFIVFFGNEKLATGTFSVQPLIRQAVESAGFLIEQQVTGKISELQPHKAKLAILAAYGRIIPQRVLDEFPLGIINVHPSLLPQYRGPTPIEQAILDGATKTGVSIMQLTAKMDEGPIYRQKILHLIGQESKIELVERLQRLGSELLVEILPAIADGSLKPRQQPHADRATYSRLIKKDDGWLDAAKPAVQLACEVRAYAGWPGSRLTVNNREIIITKAHVSAQADSKELTLETTDGFLVIDRLKPAGKNEMGAADFIRGYFNN